MKKRLAFVLVAALTFSACGSGTEKTSTNSTTTSIAVIRNGDVPKINLRKFGANVGAGFVTGLAMNAIGMGLAAIPGMPKELAGLFGGGGADNAEVLKAIAEIKAMIEALDKKVDDIQTTLNELTANVSALNEKVDMVARNLCGTTQLVQTAPLKEVMTFVNSDWRDLFGEEGAARQAIANEQAKNLAYTPSDERAILDIYTRISKNYKAKYNQAIYGDVLLSKNGQRGLISQIQACTLTQKRFLTNRDSLTWKAYVDSFVYNQYKALQVELFVLGFESYLEAKNAAIAAGLPFDQDSVRANTRAIAKVVAEFIANANAEYAMVSNAIPVGQVIDTVSRKAWAVTEGSTISTLSAAMSTCLKDTTKFSNTRSIHTPNGIKVESISPCPSTSGLDGVGDNVDAWRIPNLWELSASSLVTAKTDWYNSSLGAGIIDSGSNGVGSFGNANGSNNCGPNGTSGTPCTTATQYLKALGASVLVDRLPANVSAVWSNTSYAATYKTASHPANRSASNSQIAAVNNVFKSTNELNSIAPIANGYLAEVASGGWHSGSNWDREVKNTCAKEPQTYYHGGQQRCIDLYSWSDKNNDYQNDRCSQLRNDTPVLQGLTQVHVVNIGSNAVNKKVNDSVPSVWGGVNAFATGKYFASQSRVDIPFLCSHYWKDFWGSWGEYAHFRNYLPQEAGTMLVRNLAQNEVYYFLDGDNLTNNSVLLRQQVETPTVLISSTDATYRVDTFSTFGNALTVRCLVLPSTSAAVPTSWAQLNEPCPRATDTALTLGDYNIYAMAYDTVSKLYSPITSNSVSIVGPAPLLPTKIAYTAGVSSLSVTASTLAPEFSYELKVVAPNGTATKCKVLIAVGACGISGLTGDSVYKASLVVTSGGRTKESAGTNLTVMSPPTTTSTTSTAAPIAAPALPMVKPSNGSVELVKRSTTDTNILSYEARFDDGRTACTFTASATGCVISGLQNGFSYSFSLIAITKAGRSVPTALTVPVVPIPAPLQPLGIIASASSARVDVGISANSLSSPVSVYNVKLEDVSGNTYACDAPGTLASCSIDGVPRGMGYLVTVTARNDSGTASISKKFYVAGPPVQPVIKEASASDSSLYVEIADTNVTANTDHFIAVSSPGNKSCEFSLPTTGCTLPATNGTNYVVTIVGVSDLGEKGLAIKTKTLSPAAPPAPEPAQIAKQSATPQVQPTEQQAVAAVEALPAPTPANIKPASPAMSIGQKYSISQIKAEIGGVLKKATSVKIKVAGASKSICSASASGVIGKQVGYCVLTVSGVSKSAGKKTTVKQMFTIAIMK